MNRDVDFSEAGPPPPVTSEVAPIDTEFGIGFLLGKAGLGFLEAEAASARLTAVFTDAPKDTCHWKLYRVSHLLVHLGWVDFHLGVPPSFPAAQPFLPNFHQQMQNQADSGTLIRGEPL